MLITRKAVLGGGRVQKELQLFHTAVLALPLQVTALFPALNLHCSLRSQHLLAESMPSRPQTEPDRERDHAEMQLCSSDLSPGRAIVVMGVSGSGKSTTGKLLAESLGCSFLDADDFHSEENKEKMKQGIPLTDSDRLPWLETLRDTLIDYILQGKTVVLACSALKPSYRQLLRTADFQRMLETQQEGDENQEERCLLNDSLKSLSKESKKLHDNQQLNGNPESHGPLHQVTFLLLNGPIELFASRLNERFQQGAHFMPPSLLLSQIDSLAINEKEDDVICLDASLSPAAVVQHAKELICQNA